LPKIPFISTEKIIQDWKKKQFKPIYWFEGEEGYYIDQLMDYAEHHLLTPEESAFNLVVFYGKDAVWSEVINACRRYPMFAERQVVLLKEAQQMKDIDKLEPYIDQPLSSTIFVVGHKEKKLDGRGSMSKTLKKKGEVLTTKKLYDNQLPEWTSQLVHHKGFLIDPKALYLLVDHIGNDLSRISNEVDKLIVNLGKSREIKEEDIEKYIGVSREFNVFELQNAIAKREMTKAVRIIRYFEDNPKAGPIQMVLPVLNKNKMQGLSHVVEENNSDEWNKGDFFTVPLKKLDDMPEINAQTVNAIKIDVEGFEYEVLQGAKKLLQKDKPVIYCEVWDNEKRSRCFNFMKELGYSIKVLSNDKLVDYINTPETNFFFCYNN